MSSKDCSRCDGDGTITCPRCSGRGSVEEDGYIPWISDIGDILRGEDDKDHNEECPNCDGSGEIQCSKCNGNGVIDDD